MNEHKLFASIQGVTVTKCCILSTIHFVHFVTFQALVCWQSFSTYALMIW